MFVRKLGLILDNTRGMEKQVNSICKSCYYKIRNIGLIRKYRNDETCKTLVQALVISWLNYGNALLYDILISLTNRLQRTRKREHITRVMFQLHWFHVCFQVTVQNSISYIQRDE